ncbi:MAG TPA: DUF983 domain-containing protein [Flavobacteriales bacterium]|nr:DUF983 domain-containing protein [Flavobacteriales bacterium]
MNKGSKLYSILRFKCPHCHEGEFFMDSNPYNLAKAGELHGECPVCHRKYSREPGFYYGAMYVAYALGVALFVSVYVAIYVLYPEASTELYIGGVLGSLVVAGPYVYALSKIIWANLFYAYKGVEATAEEKARQAR